MSGHFVSEVNLKDEQCFLGTVLCGGVLLKRVLQPKISVQFLADMYHSSVYCMSPASV